MQEDQIISIIIRTYNSEKFIDTAIKSVLKQTINQKLLDVLVIDDGSTDGTINILNLYKENIRVIEQPHKGAMRALNFGIDNARGEYLILLDADDYFEPTILEKMYNVLKNNDTASFVYGDYFEKNEEGSVKKVSLENIFNSVAGGIMFRKKIIQEMGGYDESMIFPEYDLLIKILKKYKGIHLNEPLFTYLRHGKSITADKEIVKNGKEQLFKKYGIINNLREY